MGGGGGREAREGGEKCIHVVQQKLTQCCKAIVLQLEKVVMLKCKFKRRE